MSTRYLLSNVHCTNKVWKHEINLNNIEVLISSSTKIRCKSITNTNRWILRREVVVIYVSTRKHTYYWGTLQSFLMLQQVVPQWFKGLKRLSFQEGLCDGTNAPSVSSISRLLRGGRRDESDLKKDYSIDGILGGK